MLQFCKKHGKDEVTICMEMLLARKKTALGLKGSLFLNGIGLP